MHMLVVIAAFTFGTVTPFLSAPRPGENTAEFSQEAADEAPSGLAKAEPDDGGDLA